MQDFANYLEGGLEFELQVLCFRASIFMQSLIHERPQYEI
jgi:hypothetical protein